VHIVVDADALAYTAGFASQRVRYDYTVHVAGDVISEGIVDTRDEYAAAEAMMPEGASLEVATVIEAEPLVNALAMVKRTLLSIESALDEAGLEFDRMHLYLTGKGNFRESLATIKGYKANRIGLERPVHYKAIRRYLKERWGAQVVSGMEADDALAMEAALYAYDPERVCIVSMDKDLMTVPGRLYNFKRKKMYITTPIEALRNFYTQILVGDTVDNIGGCYKCGPKKAEELLGGLETEEAMYAAVLAEYARSLARPGCPYGALGAEGALLENARLLHLLRLPGKMWEPPGSRTDPTLRNALRGRWITVPCGSSTRPLPSNSPSLSEDAPAEPAAPNP
jgi:hypothetical protein